MSAVIFQFRPFQNARIEVAALKLGPNIYNTVVRRIAAAQKAGDSGAHVAGELGALRRRQKEIAPPPEGDAA